MGNGAVTMHYVLVLSGKGGTGKTITAINLAHELAKKKGSVALIDADLSNPNAAELLGVKDQISITSESFTPITVDGIEFFSMATISGDKPVSMDATEYAQILRDVLKHSKWKSEIGVIDLPAGLHNEFLELLTNFGENLLGSVVVLQPAHVESTRKMLQLHKSEGVPVLGVIQNMSGFTCAECGKTYDIFGNVDLEGLCKEFEVEPLGSIPLSMDIRKGVIEGKPFLPENLIKPITKGVEKILEAKPVGVSFVERLKERLKEIARDALIDIIAAVVEISNTEIGIPDIQKAHGFPGGRTIELDITDESLRNVKIQAFFRVEGGILKIVKNPKKVDDEIRVWERALLWSILSRRTDTNMPFDLMDAWLQGKVKYFSNTAGTPRALQFLRSVWGEVKNTPSFNKLKPLLERIS
jgi:Mrp family chromosome partitioning ATPase